MVIFLLLLSACNGQSANSGGAGDAPDTVVLIVEASGGCMMAGPNCPRYVLKENGEFDLYRASEDKFEISSVIDKALVDELIAVAAEVDFDQLRGSLGEGECRACFDGVDFEYILYPDSRNEKIGSREHKVSVDIPLFKLYLEVTRQMGSSAQLPLVRR